MRRRRRMLLSEKVFLVKQFYTNGGNWEFVQDEFNMSYKVQTSPQLEKLMKELVTRFEDTGSVTQDFHFEVGMIIKNEADYIPEKKASKPKKVIKDIPVNPTHQEEPESVDYGDEPADLPIKEELAQEEETADSPPNTEILESQPASDCAEDVDTQDDDHLKVGFFRKSYKCPVPSCQKVFDTNQKKNRHKHYWHKPEEYANVVVEREYICEFCGMSFKTTHQKWRHKEKEHRKKKRPIAPVPKEILFCDICSRPFTTERGMKCHKKKMHEEPLEEPLEEPIVLKPVPQRRSYFCQTCFLSFETREAKYQHNVEKHLPLMKDGRVNSGDCGKEVNMTSLAQHRKTHTPLNKLPLKPCPVCHKMFRAETEHKGRQKIERPMRKELNG